MEQTSINIQMAQADEMMFKEICEQLGMTMATAFNIFAKAVIRQGGFPFELNLERPNAETLEAIEDVNLGRNLFGPYKSIDALWEALDA